MLATPEVVIGRISGTESDPAEICSRMRCAKLLLQSVAIAICVAGEAAVRGSNIYLYGVLTSRWLLSHFLLLRSQRN